MIQTNDIITVSGVSGYIDQNGTAFLRLEDVARGLGFTETAASGNETVRWRTVRGYLNGFGIATCCDDSIPEYIPENIFYRLAMKAKNATAETFQAKVADEILPTIRKTGSYSARPMTQIEMLAAQAQAMVELEKKVTVTQNRLDGAVEALAAPTPKDWQTETGNRIKRICKENGLSYLDIFGKLDEELEDQAHVDLQSRASRRQSRMKKGGYTSREVSKVSKLHVVGRDPILKLAFDGIVRRFAAKYAGKEA